MPYCVYDKSLKSRLSIQTEGTAEPSSSLLKLPVGTNYLEISFCRYLFYFYTSGNQGRESTVQYIQTGCRRGKGTAGESGTRHCPWAPKSGGVGRMTFRGGAGTVRPNVVMSGMGGGDSADTPFT